MFCFERHPKELARAAKAGGLEEDSSVAGEFSQPKFAKVDHEP